MKKVILTVAASVGLSLAAHSQGVVQFQNQGGGVNGSIDLQTGSTLSYATSFTTALYYGVVSGAATTTPIAGQNAYGYLTYSAFLNGVTSDGLTLAATTSALGASSAGSFNGGTATLGIAGGYASGAYTVQDVFVLAAWTGNYATLAAAVAGGANYGIITFLNNVGPGGSAPQNPALLGWNSLTPTPAVEAFEGGPGFPDLVMSATPEPGTMALAGLGSLSLFFLRRKK